MILLRNITSRFDRHATGLEVLTPRLLKDAGIERSETRSVMGSMIASLTPNYVVEMMMRAR